MFDANGKLLAGADDTELAVLAACMMHVESGRTGASITGGTNGKVTAKTFESWKRRDSKHSPNMMGICAVLNQLGLRLVPVPTGEYEARTSELKQWIRISQFEDADEIMELLGRPRRHQG